MEKKKERKKVLVPIKLRQKLVAAVSMVLVSMIMLVSTTYAWFTLSTAPEVTGITTSVGANGNLEIALLNGTTIDLESISSAVGDSTEIKGSVVSNISWGNLVDLSDESYGTAKFVLNPARFINSDTTKKPVLMTATYGSDGRVKEVLANTVTGTYNTSKTAFVEGNFGVRGIGTANAMSEGTLALRNSISQIGVLIATAKNGVQTALSANGSKLASLAVAYQDATEANPYVLTEADVTAINVIGNSINTAKVNIESALKYAAMAKAISEDAKASKDFATYSVTNDFEAAKNALDTISTIPAITIESNSTDVENVIKMIMGDNFTINGFTLENARKSENVSSLFSKLMTDGGLKVEIPVHTTEGSVGALAYVANAVGNVSANIRIEKLSKGDIALEDVPASLSTKESADFVMKAVVTTVSGYTAKDSVETPAENLITDIYGYAIDFAFRTNASSSNLLLQVDEAQRIYTDSVDETTQGGGSYMEFTRSVDLNNTQFKNLLNCIRVVFTGADNQILAVAVLNTGADPISGDTFKAPLKLVNFTYAENKITINGDKGDNVILALEQNSPMQLTATVFLDGDAVDNSMVSATSAKSLTGTMNLQFASSAVLVPMDYTPLHTTR